MADVVATTCEVGFATSLYTVTQSFHENLSCVVRTGSFLPLGVRHHIFRPISFFIQPCSCGQRAKPGSAACVNIRNTSPSMDRFYSKTTCFALSICAPTPGVRNGLSQTDMSRLLLGVDAMRKAEPSCVSAIAVQQ